MTETLETLLAALDLPVQAGVAMPTIPGVALTCAVAMPADRSFDRWQAIDARARALGYVALGVGSEQRRDQLCEHLTLAGSWDLERELEVALALDVDAWLAEREREELEDRGELPLGSWRAPSGPPRGGLWFPFDDGEHLDPWWMALVPASAPWAAPLSLAYGNWNDCPHATVHAAMCRRWEKSHGAQLVAVGPDTLELVVEEPPTTPNEALALAKEHYLYCTDIVDQGCGTIAALAASLLGASTWSFWWD